MGRSDASRAFTRKKRNEMNKKTIITVLLALVALAGQAKTFKTIKNPVAMACVNVSLSCATRRRPYISR